MIVTIAITITIKSILFKLNESSIINNFNPVTTQEDRRDRNFKNIFCFRVAAESISKHSISYETITAAELLIEDTASQIEESSEKSIDNNLANSSEINNIGNDIYISVRKDVTTDETELNFNPPSTQTVPLKEETRSTEKADSSSSSSSEQSDVEEKHIYKFECLYCPTLFIAQSDVLQHLKDEHPDEGREIVLLNDNETQQNPKSEITKEPVKTEPEETDTKKKPGRRSFHVRYMTKHPLPKINQEEVNKAKVEVDGRVFYMCKQCGKSLHSMYTYVWHTRIHTGERPYVCNLCSKQFRVSQGLVRHLKETHERIKNFDCDICGRRFATRRNVEEHRRIHTNERPYVCATCGKSFKQKASLFVHNRSHSTEFPFSCSECPQKFRTKPSLLVHVTKHTGEKPFPCDVCGRNFRIKYELKRHKLIHSEDKPFTCKICTQSFRQKRYLRNHLKLNHNISNPNEWLEEYINAI